MPAVDDFDEKILEAIKRGALSPLKIAPLDYARAFSLRAKFYRTRKRLIANEHPLASAARNVSFHLRSENGDFALYIQPKDLGYEQAYLNAGLIDPEDSPPDLDA